MFADPAKLTPGQVRFKIFYLTLIIALYLVNMETWHDIGYFFLATAFWIFAYELFTYYQYRKNKSD